MARFRRLWPGVGIGLVFAAGLGWCWTGAGDTGPNSPEPPPDLALDARVEQFAGRAEKAAAPVAKVLQALALPYDEIELEGKKTIRVEPVAKYLGSPGSFSGTVKVREAAKEGKDWSLTKADVLAWRPYEEIALAQVKALRQDMTVPARARLTAAQAIVVAVWHFHLDRRDRPPAGVNPWHPVEVQLDKELLQVRLDYLHHLTESAGAPELKDRVLPFTEQLTKAYPATATVRAEAALAWARYAGLLLDDGKTEPAAAALAQAEQLQPDLPKIKALRQQLQEKWPLPEGKPVLRVGVPELPESLSPALAWTDAE